MNDDGYTLGECLIAVFILSLAAGGLYSGLALFNREQASAARLITQERAERQLHEGLSVLLDGQGPFVAPVDQSFSGSPSQFRFDCGLAHQDCRVWLARTGDGLALHVDTLGAERSFALPKVSSAQFVYTGTRTVGIEWPPAVQGRETLKAVGVLAQTVYGSLPLVSVPIWVDEPLNCEFDPISKDCRS